MIFSAKFRKEIIAPLLLALALGGCTKDTSPEQLRTLTLMFEPTAGSEPFEFERRYVNAASDTFWVSAFQMYLSNFSVGTAQAETQLPDTYKLLNFRNRTASFASLSVPKSLPITHLSFHFGIDSVRNLSLDTVGDLDPSNNMAWNWKQGYKFLLLEGKCITTEGAERGLVYHVGGAGAYKKIGLGERTPLPDTVRIKVDVLSFFNGRHQISLSAHNSVMSGEIAEKVAENLQNGAFRPAR